MVPLVRSDATDAEKYMIAWGLLLGLLPLGAGFLLVLAGSILHPFGSIPLMGQLGIAVAILGGVLLPPMVALARRGSTVAWAGLMVAFLVHMIVGGFLASIQGIVPGAIGLYLGYRALKDAAFGRPV